MRVPIAVKALVICAMGIYALASTPESSAASAAAVVPCDTCVSSCPDPEYIQWYCSFSTCQGEAACFDLWGTDYGCGPNVAVINCGAEM